MGAGGGVVDCCGVGGGVVGKFAVGALVDEAVVDVSLCRGGGLRGLDVAGGHCYGCVVRVCYTEGGDAAG